MPIETKTSADREDEIDLGGRFGRVHVLFYEAVRLQVEFMIPTLEPGKIYTSRQLCGEGYWAMLIGLLERRQVGMCLRDLVNRGVLPLVWVKRKAKYPKKYRLK